MSYTSVGSIWARGSSAEEELPNMFGDYDNHPLTLYMRAVMPGAFGMGALGTFFGNVRLALLAMQYQGQPGDLLGVAVRSVAASNADEMAPPQSLAWNSIAMALWQKLIPVANEVAAMPKPPTPPMRLSLSPAFMACVKAKGTWDAQTSTCALPKSVTRQASTVQRAASPPPPGTTSHLGLYLGIAAAVAVVGTVGYMTLRR